MTFMDNINGLCDRDIVHINLAKYYYGNNDPKTYNGTSCLCVSDSCNNNDWGTVFTTQLKGRVTSKQAFITKKEKFPKDIVGMTSGDYPSEGTTRVKTVSMVETGTDDGSAIHGKQLNEETTGVDIANSASNCLNDMWAVTMSIGMLFYLSAV